jgi:hypothetical protein
MQWVTGFQAAAAIPAVIDIPVFAFGQLHVTIDAISSALIRSSTIGLDFLRS